VVLLFGKKFFNFFILLTNYLKIMKLKFGMIVVDGSGKLGGHVISKNRSGSYARTKVSPKLVQNGYTGAVRSRMAAISISWMALGQTLIAAWNAAVAAFKKTNVFGDSVKPSGFNLYQALNNNLVNVGEAMIDTPPEPQAIGVISNLVLTANHTGPVLSVAFSTVIGADEKVKLFAAEQQSVSRVFNKSAYRQIAVKDATFLTGASIYNDYHAKYPVALAAGLKIGIKMVIVNTVSGQAGQPVYAEAEIA
jgi:hypothetical protein